MLAEWMIALEETALAKYLRGSVTAYPLVNTGHLIGIALLVGSSIPLNLRIAGLWRSVELEPLRRVLNRSFDAGLALAIGFGILLFLPRASQYIRSGLFIAKMAALAAGILLSLVTRRAYGRALPVAPGSRGALPMHLRIMAGGSIAIWLSVLVLGRLVGYF
jgi:hypothetical protein